MLCTTVETMVFCSEGDPLQGINIYQDKNILHFYLQVNHFK